MIKNTIDNNRLNCLLITIHLLIQENYLKLMLQQVK